jgi:hypothetical protein
VGKLEREIDELFALPLDQFTSRRNELARRLKREGDKDAAEQVQAMDKPSVPAWAINQSARAQKNAVKNLLDAGTKLRKAQERALAGGRSDVLRAAQNDLRRSVRALTGHAAETLKDAGRPPSRAILERISSTLGAAAVTDPARQALREGRLTDEVKVTGFDALAALEIPKRKSGASRDELAVRRRQKADTKRRRELETVARELHEQAGAAERDAEIAKQAADDARKLAERKRRAAEAAARELAKLGDE